MKLTSHPCGIECHPTPWDTNAFGVKTYEIVIPNINNLDVANAIEEVNQITSVKNSSLFCSRINAKFNNCKLVLYEAGFHNCETQLHIINSNIKNYSTPKELGNRRLQLDLAVSQDYIEVAKKSSEVFKFSRFHEDPYVKPELANLRMQLWCEDMHKQKVPLLIYKNKAGELDSFIYYKNTNENSVELILGGSMPGKGMMTPLFWASFIEYFQAIGINCIKTKISASNITIANIYIFFDFRIKETYFDFHKHIFYDPL